MMDMLERIASKLCKLDHPDMPDDWHERAWPEWCEDASAVIAEMREPTEVMTGCAAYAMPGVLKEHVEENQNKAHRLWREMIDAALATPPQT